LAYSDAKGGGFAPFFFGFYWYSVAFVSMGAAVRETSLSKARRAGNGKPLPSGATPRMLVSRLARGEPYK